MHNMRVGFVGFGEVGRIFCAGVKAAVPDSAYEAAGAKIAKDAAEAARDAAVVLKVQRPEAAELAVLDIEAIQKVRQEAWPLVRDASEPKRPCRRRHSGVPALSSMCRPGPWCRT